VKIEWEYTLCWRTSVLQHYMRRIERPRGLYVMVAYDFLVGGVIPLLFLVFAVRNSGAEVSFITVLMSVALYFCVMGAAVWAWWGDDTGRWVLLFGVTWVALQWIVNALQVLSASEVMPGDNSRRMGVIFRAAITITLNWWYFNRKSTVRYYKQAKRYRKP
jgi:uncharacterized integral membrane protein